MKRRYASAFIAVMIAGSLFMGCGSAARDNVSLNEKDINETQTVTKAIADKETSENVTKKQDSENNKQSDNNFEETDVSDLSENQTDATQTELSEDADNIKEDSYNSNYQDDNGYQDNDSELGDNNDYQEDSGENQGDSSSGGSSDISDDESLYAEARINTVTYSEFANRVLELVNIERANAGVAPLVLDEALCNAANMRAIEMDRTGEFSHTRPDGSSCFGVLDVYNVEWNNACGENIAAGQASPEAVMESWLNSPGHKANIISPEFTRLGLGYSTGRGGAFHHYWAQEFAG